MLKIAGDLCLHESFLHPLSGVSADDAACKNVFTHCLSRAGHIQALSAGSVLTLRHAHDFTGGVFAFHHIGLVNSHVHRNGSDHLSRLRIIQYLVQV